MVKIYGYFLIQIQNIDKEQKMGYITREGLKQLDNYKYKGGQYTMLDNLMNHYWQFCAKFLPQWLAPNLITFIGWCFVIASYANILRYDYTFTKQLPASAFFFASFCIFTYSTLDAIDGKQARKTKSSSPLGQLFDHGCDSFSLTFFILGVCQATRIQKDEVFLIFIVCQIAFWTSTWAQHHTGVLRTKVGQFGVTEGEYTIVLIHFLTGLFGQNMWNITASNILPNSILKYGTNSPYLNYIFTQQLGNLVVYGFAIGIILITIYTIIRTLIVAQDKLQAISQHFTIMLLVVMELAWSTFNIYQKYNGVILVNFGVLSSFIVCKIIICSVTKMHFQYFHFELIPLIITTLLMMSLQKLNVSMSVMSTLFWLCFAVNIGLILQFLHSTINQITSYLGIQCFSLKKNPRKLL